MVYEVAADDAFQKEFAKLQTNTKNTVKKKIQMLEENPFRFKRLKGFNFPTYRIRINDNNKKRRLIYEIRGNKVILMDIIDRKDDYKDV